MTREEAAAITRLTEDITHLAGAMLLSAEELTATGRAFVELLQADSAERKRTAERSGDLAARAQSALDAHRRGREGTAAAARNGAHLRLVE